MAITPTDFVFGRYPMDGTDISVKNTSGSSLAGGLTVKIDTGNLILGTQPIAGVTTTAAVTDFPDGVSVETIPIGYPGRIQIAGIGICTALGAIAGGATVGASATAGQVTAYTVTDPYFGKAWSQAVSAADPVLVHICPGVTA